MSKRSVVAIALLGFFTLSVPRSVEPMQIVERQPELLVITEGRVAEFMLEINPLLSQSEANRIGRAVIRYSIHHGVDPEIVMAVIVVESGARPWVESQKGAVGLMQVMPYMKRRRGDVAGNLTNVEVNVDMGCWILADNIKRLGEEDGISAYFWGGNIRGVGYLNKIQSARSKVRRFLQSSR